MKTSVLGELDRVWQLRGAGRRWGGWRHNGISVSLRNEELTKAVEFLMFKCDGDEGEAEMPAMKC